MPLRTNEAGTVCPHAATINKDPHAQIVSHPHAHVVHVVETHADLVTVQAKKVEQYVTASINSKAVDVKIRARKSSRKYSDPNRPEQDEGRMGSLDRDGYGYGYQSQLLQRGNSQQDQQQGREPNQSEAGRRLMSGPAQTFESDIELRNGERGFTQRPLVSEPESVDHFSSGIAGSIIENYAKIWRATGLEEVDSTVLEGLMNAGDGETASGGAETQQQMSNGSGSVDVEEVTVRDVPQQGMVGNGRIFASEEDGQTPIFSGSLYKLGGNSRWQWRTFRFDGRLLVCLSSEKMKVTNDATDFLDKLDGMLPLGLPLPTLSSPLLAVDDSKTDNGKSTWVYMPKWAIHMADVEQVALLKRSRNMNQNLSEQDAKEAARLEKMKSARKSFLIRTREGRNYILRAKTKEDLDRWVFVLSRMWKVAVLERKMIEEQQAKQQREVGIQAASMSTQTESSQPQRGEQKRVAVGTRINQDASTQAAEVAATKPSMGRVAASRPRTMSSPQPVSNQQSTDIRRSRSIPNDQSTNNKAYHQNVRQKKNPPATKTPAKTGWDEAVTDAEITKFGAEVESVQSPLADNFLDEPLAPAPSFIMLTLDRLAAESEGDQREPTPVARQPSNERRQGSRSRSLPRKFSNHRSSQTVNPSPLSKSVKANEDEDIDSESTSSSFSRADVDYTEGERFRASSHEHRSRSASTDGQKRLPPRVESRHVDVAARKAQLTSTSSRSNDLGAQHRGNMPSSAPAPRRRRTVDSDLSSSDSESPNANDAGDKRRSTSTIIWPKPPSTDPPRELTLERRAPSSTRKGYPTLRRGPGNPLLVQVWRRSLVELLDRDPEVNVGFGASAAAVTVDSEESEIDMGIEVEETLQQKQDQDQSRAVGHVATGVRTRARPRSRPFSAYMQHAPVLA
ncbi:hypothetical protein HK102_004913 [Quaeritorhiza haematococci]|nr:hypothetical protein HK102_004913 [Quaeritorhiza haematococci]